MTAEVKVEGTGDEKEEFVGVPIPGYSGGVCVTSAPNTINMQAYGPDGKYTSMMSRGSTDTHRDVHIMNAALELVQAIKLRNVDIDPDTLYRHLVGAQYTVKARENGDGVMGPAALEQENQYLRQRIDAVTMANQTLQQQLAATMEQLKDPTIVHKAMLIGEIAKLPVEAALHVHGEEPVTTYKRGEDVMRSKALLDILEERVQQSMKGYTAAHDDEHVAGEIAEAAVSYALGTNVETGWPEGWKFNHKLTERQRLVRAAALLVAEIERLDRKVTN